MFEFYSWILPPLEVLYKGPHKKNTVANLCFIRKPYQRILTLILNVAVSSVSDPDWIWIQSGQWMRIPEDKNEPKNKKSLEISCFEVLGVLF